ncbi:MAG: outer membrane beta-barrel protein [Crocinitomicaceae bacterium]
MQLIKSFRLLLILALAQVSFYSSAQLSVGLDAGIVKRSLFQPYYGGELSVNYSVSDIVRIGVHSGFYHQQSNSITNISTGETFRTSSKLIPVSLSSEFVLPLGKFKPYLGAHVGMLREVFGIGDFKGSTTYFNLSPVVGLDYQISSNIGLNANFKYGLAFGENQFDHGREPFETFSPNLGVRYTF